MLRFLTAGESHGPALTGIIEGIPAGLELKESDIDYYLQRRQRSYGRGNRMKKIEKDRVIILGGVRDGKTIGSPIALQIINKDWAIRKNRKSLRKKVPRPGHADLAGAIKYGFDDIQNVIERSSARETAMRTAVGAVTKIFLEQFDINIVAHVIRIGSVGSRKKGMSYNQIKTAIDKSPVYCIDADRSALMCQEIDKALENGDTLGGTFETMAFNVPVGLGSYVHWDRKIEARLAQAIMSIPSVKAVEIGDGVKNAARRGSRAHDKLYIKNSEVIRKSNRAGGVEGGVTNGSPLVIRGYAKPISSLREPLPSVNLETKQPTLAPYVRSDVCVVPAICIIAEAMTSWVLADCFLSKYGGDSMAELKRHFETQIGTGT